MGQGCSADALVSPTSLEKEAMSFYINKKAVGWDMEKHENGENNIAGNKFLEVTVLKLFLQKCTRK